MYFVVLDLGCSECGESSNVLGIYTSQLKAKDALTKYKKVHHLENDLDHEFFIYKIDELNKIYHNSYEHIVE
ncbi:hypothetical protein [Metabacillus malikii]|nr:hypothetical protein [Metabacillus malikii]